MPLAKRLAHIILATSMMIGCAVPDDTDLSEESANDSASVPFAELTVLARDRSCSKAQPCTRLPSAPTECTLEHPCDVRLPYDHEADDLAKAIEATLASEVPTETRPLYFEQELTSARERTPDGGGFQFFQGAWGRGAIYAHLQSDGVMLAQPIYGDILATWEHYGWETILGYPSSPEQDASDPAESINCLSRGGDRQQHFGIVAWDDGAAHASEAVICWSPSQGTFVLPETLADALQRGESVTRLAL
jgi:hypothetical protein